MRDTSLESMPSGGHVPGAAGSPTRALVLATISFTLLFAAWGLVGGLASVFTRLYSLTASQTALLVAVPVLLGSLTRLPVGMLRIASADVKRPFTRDRTPRLGE
jgi:hypothetical protein